VHHGLDSRNWASTLNCDGRYGLALLAACALLLLPQAWGSTATNLLRYDRAAIAAGQWWRLLTAQIAHLGLHHALLNTLGLVFLWALFAREWKPLQWGVIAFVVTVAIDGGLWFLDSGITWYVGASGTLHGLMVAGVVAYIGRRDPLGWIMAGLLVVKLAYEHLQGPLPFAGRGVPVVVDAHLYGALGGLVTSIFLTRWRPRGSQKPKPPVRQTPVRGSTAPQT
jgi:rhomboid family GlyGly-CTERM serine protease